MTDEPTDGRTDRQTDRWTDEQTDIPSYRDARTHLKKLKIDQFFGGNKVTMGKRRQEGL